MGRNRTAVVGMVTSSHFNMLGLKSKGSLIGNEFGVNPPRPIINWTGLPCLLPARTAWAQIAGKLRNLRSHGAQLRVNPNESVQGARDPLGT